LIRIRNDIDPFFVKVDDSENCRTSADLSGEENEKKLPKGDFGDYCPVTYVKDNWIVRGNPENEVTVFGKTHWLAGASELEEFKFNPK
jgi:adenylate/nucleoside-diphosphate kinase